jgi:outer membrane biosynthesis protein TonB
MAQTLPAALEPELRRIIDTAVARVASIELDAIREARELTQRSEQEAREALRFALDRAFNLINTLELLAATVSGMAEALKIELDDAIDALRNVPEPESALAKEMAARETAAPAAAQAPPAQEAPPVPEPEPAPPPAPGPPPEPAPVAEQTPALEPAQEPEPPAAAQEPEPPAAAQEQPEPQPEREPQREPEPQRTVLVASASSDGRPAEPGRQRGLMRRLFSK